MLKLKSNLYAAILAGGVGSRFWPLSRESSPKQLLNVVGEDSLLHATIERLAPLVSPENIRIITNPKQAELIRHHLKYKKGEKSPGYVVEPVGRNTAPAIGLAAMELVREDPDAIMAVLPADHLIKDKRGFRKALKAAALAAELGKLVTFGVVPTRPETGYGYILAETKELKRIEGLGVWPIKNFVEKPDITLAKKYLKHGGYFWNSGIFVWKASKVLEEIERYQPELYKGLKRISEGGDIEGIYPKLPSVSIDNGIMEFTEDAVVIEAHFPWYDLGSWTSLEEHFKLDKSGNLIKGRSIDIGSTNSIIMGAGRVVATIGLDNLIVVDTPDATLVCPKDRAQDVKGVVDELKKKGWSEHVSHKTTVRPWGSYTILEEGQGYKIKKICVNPGSRLSLQSHKRRSEHWVVINGTATVERDGEEEKVKKNESTYIAIGVKHRLANKGRKPLEIIEVQNGSYLEEDDIKRYADDFDRI